MRVSAALHNITTSVYIIAWFAVCFNQTENVKFLNLTTMSKVMTFSHVLCLYALDI